ncbi:MAG: N-acetylmuramoyl-L-alanine amidase, partial [Paludibacteraceae bacterium]|nr:N-acetylmuramoyl-L-alanine amidase [Paludibacteraceae bacterium]
MRKQLFLFIVLLLGLPMMAAKSYTVVLDAGHGGKDPGAVGRISKEKDLNLKLALQVGKLLREQYPDVKVVFTRATDVFIPLQQRADIANKNKADLFISIHTNSSESKTPCGV